MKWCKNLIIVLMLIILTNDNEHDNTIEMCDELKQDNINSNGKLWSR